jgi:hypothetical protein
MTTATKTITRKATSSAKAKAPVKKVVSGKTTLEKAPAPEATMTPLEAAKAKKLPKTVLKNGLTYSLLTRVRNAFKKDTLAGMEKGKETMKMVDGRGTEHTISKVWEEIALEVGGAKYLASVRTSKVRIKLREMALLPTK